jgi:nitrite reductase/ring-hydroxylating ferredoxin subunit
MTTETQSERAGTTNYPLCRIDEVPDRTAKAIELRGINPHGEVDTCPIIVVRWAEQVYGYINTCPHKPTQLDASRPGKFWNEEHSHLMCDKHGAIFEVDTGMCLDGPCQGKGLTPLSVQVIDGEVCLTGVQVVETPDA